MYVDLGGKVVGDGRRVGEEGKWGAMDWTKQVICMYGILKQKIKKEIHLFIIHSI